MRRADQVDRLNYMQADVRVIWIAGTSTLGAHVDTQLYCVSWETVANDTMEGMSLFKLLYFP